MPYREPASLRASERYGIKNEWIIIVIICLLYITRLKKSSHQVEVQDCKAILPHKAILPAKFDVRRQLKSKI